MKLKHIMYKNISSNLSVAKLSKNVLEGGCGQCQLQEKKLDNNVIKCRKLLQSYLLPPFFY